MLTVASPDFSCRTVTVNLPGEADNDADLPQFVTALGAAFLGHRRLEKLAAEKAAT